MTKQMLKKRISQRRNRYINLLENKRDLPLGISSDISLAIAENSIVDIETEGRFNLWKI